MKQVLGHLAISGADSFDFVGQPASLPAKEYHSWNESV